MLTRREPRQSLQQLGARSVDLAGQEKAIAPVRQSHSQRWVSPTALGTCASPAGDPLAEPARCTYELDLRAQNAACCVCLGDRRNALAHKLRGFVIYRTGHPFPCTCAHGFLRTSAASVSRFACQTRHPPPLACSAAAGGSSSGTLVPLLSRSRLSFGLGTSPSHRYECL